MEFGSFTSKVEKHISLILNWIDSSDFFTQCGLILLAVVLAYCLALALKKFIPVFNKQPESGRLLRLRNNIYALAGLLFPVFTILTLSIAIDVSQDFDQQNELLRTAVSLTFVIILYIALKRFLKTKYIKFFVKWILIPIAIMQAFGVLDDVSTYLKSISIQIGDIHISAFGITRLLVFGVIIFWLGRISNNIGKQLIHSQLGTSLLVS